MPQAAEYDPFTFEPESVRLYPGEPNTSRAWEVWVCLAGRTAFPVASGRTRREAIRAAKVRGYHVTRERVADDLRRRNTR